MDDSLHERGRAMEDLYFQQKDHQLLEKLKAEMAKAEGRTCLEQATGIHDPLVLNKMLEVNITPESLLALSLIPLVAVAWSDGTLDSGEKDAILQAADIAGIDSASVAHQTLSNWLGSRPEPELLQAWEAYVQAMKAKMDQAVFNQFRHQVLDRAEQVAKAAGGFLGLGNKVSSVEQAMLDRLAKAFT